MLVDEHRVGAKLIATSFLDTREPLEILLFILDRDKSLLRRYRSFGL